MALSVHHLAPALPLCSQEQPAKQAPQLQKLPPAPSRATQRPPHSLVSRSHHTNLGRASAGALLVALYRPRELASCPAGHGCGGSGGVAGGCCRAPRTVRDDENAPEMFCELTSMSDLGAGHSILSHGQACSVLAVACCCVLQWRVMRQSSCIASFNTYDARQMCVRMQNGPVRRESHALEDFC